MVCGQNGGRGSSKLKVFFSPPFRCTAILSDFVLLQLRFATTKLAGQNGQCITVHANRCQKAPELINAKMQKKCKNPRYEYPHSQQKSSIHPANASEVVFVRSTDNRIIIQ